MGYRLSAVRPSQLFSASTRVSAALSATATATAAAATTATTVTASTATSATATAIARLRLLNGKAAATYLGAFQFGQCCTADLAVGVGYESEPSALSGLSVGGDVNLLQLAMFAEQF